MATEYVQARFEHYQDGTDRLSVADVFAAGFPVVPARITQEAHLFKIGYQLNDRTSINLQVPYIRQSTFHFGDTSRLAPQFGEFTIDTQGLGDTLLSTSYVVWTRGRHALVLDGGFSFPTGAIDMLGRTPRNANQDTLVPYTMQLGSGRLISNRPSPIREFRLVGMGNPRARELFDWARITGTTA